MSKEDDVNNFINKINQVTKDKKLDLSSDEDLSIGIMNLISIEEHLFFTAMKTEKDMYQDLLYQVREMRKELLKKIIKDYEGEVWCTSKHLLSASMRLMEVGTKALGKGDKKEAAEFFAKSYELYSMFWAIQLDMLNVKDTGKIAGSTIDTEKKEQIISESKNEHYISQELNKEDENKPGFMKKVTGALKKAIDCCKE